MSIATVASPAVAIHPALGRVGEADVMQGVSSGYTSVRVVSDRSDVVAAARLRDLTRPSGDVANDDVELDDYDSRALHLLAVEDGQAAGALRLVLAEAGSPLPLDSAFGITRVEDRRRGELSPPGLRHDRHGDANLTISLLRAAYDCASAVAVDDLYIAADRPLLTVLRGHGFRLRAIAGPVWASGFWGIAAVLPVDDVLPGLRLHQAVHGCQIADFFGGRFERGGVGSQICDRPAG